MGTWGEAYLTRLRGCAGREGREFGDISERDRAVRLVEGEARTVEEGFGCGDLVLESASRVQTRDPWQAPAWLVGGDPARPRWEALPQMAAYVELLRAGYPAGALRFATTDGELRLDLAAVNEEGQVLVLGVARPEPLQLSKLEALVGTFESDGGRPARGAPGRDAQQLAHQLWSTRSPYLWLVAAGARRAFRVRYGRTLTLMPVKDLPSAEELWPFGFLGPTPRIAVQGSESVAG
ncbi:hypothetical protein [Nocardioides stalactiti]|uniref:hypothetical protein n=1 Tax=Nocardioides stalactiti TaxID=2755356 RepID=UPI0015FF06C8|nr:hypothetical protein [Nocardioides stalactiti]